MHFIFLLYEILFYTKYQRTYFKNVCHSLSTKREICFHSSNNLLLLLQYVHKKIKTTTTQNNKGVKMLQMLYILFKGLILKIDLKDSCSPKSKTKAKKGQNCLRHLENGSEYMKVFKSLILEGLPVTSVSTL